MVHLMNGRACLGLALLFMMAFSCQTPHTLAVDPPATLPATPSVFTGDKTDWHGFDRYDFFLDETALTVAPADPKVKGDPNGQRRCIVVVPKTAAAGNPWSWRGCYWDHEPQTEIELLKRGFHIAYIGADASRKPDKKWDAWYAFLTEKCGLSKKPAFIGMSRGGEYAYMWATNHPDKVSCIYGDNPGGNSENLMKLEGLARNDVPLLHVCGSVDPILAKYSTTIENIYQQFGGRISVMIKEDAGHHPHSLRDSKPLADFIEQSVKEASPAVPATLPDFAPKGSSKYSYYSLENSYREFPSEGKYVTCRGPLFTETYDRYEIWIGFEVPVTIIAPRKEAPGRPWAFRADFVTRDDVVDQGLLAKGFYIVVGPTGYNSDGPQKADWDKVYKYLTDHGFSKKVVMEGSGGATAEAYAWAIENAEKVACIYGENPVLRCHMSKTQPLDNLKPLAQAGIPLLHVVGSADPCLNDNTRVLEKRYKELGGQATVIVEEGKGYFPLAPKDPKPAVDFITQHAVKVN